MFLKLLIFKFGDFKLVCCKLQINLREDRILCANEINVDELRIGGFKNEPFIDGQQIVILGEPHGGYGIIKGKRPFIDGKLNVQANQAPDCDKCCGECDGGEWLENKLD